MNENSKLPLFDVIVIGGGIQGLSVCYHLSQQNGLKVELLEQLTIGHQLGSSHGTSRMIRSIYSNPIYIKLAKRARTEDWPELEKVTGQRLIYPSTGLCFGTGENFERYVQITAESGLHSTVLDPSAARKLFPQFRFSNASAVVQDLTAGLIAAQVAVDSLQQIVRRNGVAIQENTTVHSIESDQDPIRITSDKGIFLAKKIVVTAGPWLGKLLPSLSAHLTTIRQTVGYFELHGESSLYKWEQFPVWSFIGEDKKQIFYGLPEFGRKGIKIAQHITEGKSDDPEITVLEGIPEQLDVLEQFLENQFVEPLKKRTGSETCFYTNTPSEDFILDLLPQDPRIAIGSACSGHGFKFAPLTGRILAELITRGKSNISEFENTRNLFSIPKCS